MIPKPYIVENGSFEHDILTAFVCEWINDPKQVPLHVFDPDIEVQIIKITYEAIYNRFNVDISDGRHVITATVDSNMNHMFVHRRVDVYDIIVVKEARGHPANFSFELVSYKFIFPLIFLY